MHEIIQIATAGRPPEHEDRLLVAEVLRKDRKSTAVFVGRCADYVYPFVRRRLAPSAEAVEDLMQEILLAAWQSLANFRGDATLRSWVLGIARHKVEDYYRKRIRKAENEEREDAAPEAAVTPVFDEQLDAAIQQKRVQKTIGRLPEPYALVLLWRYRDEKSVREMAELTGKTEKAIERLLARARWSFRKRWDDDKF
jgi:RNA polymerase sigma-70 factor (ECF subfamily)